MSLHEGEKYHAVVRPVATEWENKPRSLFFQIHPPIEVIDPINTGDVISNNLYDMPDHVRITPIIGMSDEHSTRGYLLRGYRPEIGGVGYFGETSKEVETRSVEFALSSLIGHSEIDVEFIDTPITSK